MPLNSNKLIVPLLLLAVCAAGLVLASHSQSASAPRSAQPRPIVDKLILDDTIQPVSADRLKRALLAANSDGAQALLIQMDTPGGMVESMRSMVGAILASRVPVIVYVSPTGARAGSAGFFLLESADFAAMAPGTEAGAAHVVFMMGKPDETEAQKVENDAEAFLRSFVTRRGRNTDAATEAVKNSHSYTAEEALDLHLIDAVANSDAQLFEAIEGREITRFDGAKTTLHLDGAEVRVLHSTMRDRLLGWLVDPNIAILFLIAGGLLIYLEFNTPGTIVPGALGTLMVLVAAFALNLLPVRYTAVLLLVAAVVLLVLEAKVGGHGALATAGIASLVFGLLTLVAAPVPEMGISPIVAVTAGLGFGLITVVLLRLAVRARKRKALIGPDALVGMAATTMEPLAAGAPGHVLVEGEIWLAAASHPVAGGEHLKVVGHNQMLLLVEPVAPAADGTASIQSGAESHSG